MATLAMQRVAMGDENARILSMKNVPSFDKGGFDDWDTFSSPNDPIDWASSDPFANVPTLDPLKSPVSRESFALNLEGFDNKVSFPSQSPAEVSTRRRRSSFSSISELKRDSAASAVTFMSSGDSTFDSAFEALLKKKEGNITEDKRIPFDQPPEKRIPDDRPPERRRPDDRPPDKTRRKRGVHRSKTSDGMTRPIATKERHHRNQRSHSSDGSAMRDESEGGKSSRLHGSGMKDESARDKPSRRGREEKHKQNKSINSVFKDESMGGGSTRIKDESGNQSPRQRCRASKSPSRRHSKRTENKKELSSAATRLHKSSGHLDAKFHRSAGSLESQTDVTGFRRTASLEEGKGVIRPVGKAIANRLNRDDLELPELNRTETQESMGMDCSSRTESSARSTNTRSRSPKKSHKSPSRSSCNSTSRSRSPKNERDRSRSNSRSRKNRATVAAAESSLLGPKSDHSERDDLGALFDELKTSAHDRSQVRSSRNKSDKHKKEPMADASSRSKGMRRVKSADFDKPMRDRSSTRTGRSEEKFHRRGRRTGSVKASLGRRTGSVESTRRLVGSEAPRGRRTGSVEAPRSRRIGSVEAPRRRRESVGARERRTHSVDAQKRLGDMQQQQDIAAIPEPSFGRSKTLSDAPQGGTGEDATPPINLPSISGLTGGEVPTWKMQGTGTKPKSQPRDQDAVKGDQKDANKGRRFTQAYWKDKIKLAKKR